MASQDADKLVSVVLIARSDADSLAVDGLPGDCAGFEWVAQALDWRAGIAAMEGKPSRLLLLDWNALGNDALGTLKELNAAVPDVPFLVFLESGDEALERNILACGAQDCLHIEDLTPRVLGRAMCHAWERKRAALEESRQKSESVADISQRIRASTHEVAEATRLLSETRLDAEQQKFVSVIRDNAEALLAQANDLSALPNEESPDAEKIPLDLWECVDKAVTVVVDQVRSKGVELACWIQPEAASGILGDPTRMRKVLASLLSTAVQFAQKQGETLLLVTVEEEDEQSISLRFAVSDNGVGISGEMQRQLFAPVTQTDARASRPSGVGGPGLSISREIVREMGGEMGVKSVAGFGSTFWFTARLEKQSVPQKIPAQLPFHALVITGRPTIRRFFSNQLRFLGLRNSTAGSVGDGAAMIAQKAASDPFNLVLLDLTMPLAKTLETARRIVAGARQNGYEVVILLPAHETIDPNILKEQNVVACLVKPVLHRALAEMLHGLANAGNDSEHGATQAQPREEKAPIRILLVEDNETNQKIASMQLRKLGYDAVIAADGLIGLSEAKSKHYDIILMDCQLPGMDGYEVTQKIREHEVASAQDAGEAKRSTIVAMTANTAQEERRKCLDAGMDDFLPKPVHNKDLRIMLERWLPKDRSEDGGAPALHGTVEHLSVPQLMGETIVDLRRLMDCVDNDRKELRLLLELYLRETDLHLSKIEEAINGGAFEEMSRRAHRCAGSSATVGMQTMVIPLRAIEQLGRAQTVAGAALHLTEARRQLELVHKFLKTHPETALCYPVNIQPNA